MTNERFLYLALTIVASIIAFFLKQFFKSQHEKIDNKITYIDDKLKTTSLELQNMRDVNANIFNDMLSKFSQWEDRIKDILHSHDQNSINKQRASDPYLQKKIIQNEIQNQINDELMTTKHFEKTKSDIGRLEKSISLMRSGLRSLKDKQENWQEEQHDKPKTLTLYKLKEELTQFESHVSEFEISLVNDIGKHNILILQLFSLCKTLNVNHKRLLSVTSSQCEKLDEIKKLAQTKITLKN